MKNSICLKKDYKTSWFGVKPINCLIKRAKSMKYSRLNSFLFDKRLTGNLFCSRNSFLIVFRVTLAVFIVYNSFLMLSHVINADLSLINVQG